MSQPAVALFGVSSRFISTSRGISDSAQVVNSIALRYEERQLNTGLARITLDKTFDNLDEISRDCSKPNWGGEDEKPLSGSALADAKAFLSSLPRKYQSPDIIPEPSGAIAFEWRSGFFRSLIVSFVGGQRVEYSSLAGRSKASFGFLAFYGLIPLEIIRHLKEVEIANAVS